MIKLSMLVLLALISPDLSAAPPSWVDGLFELIGKIAAVLGSLAAIWRFLVKPMIETFRNISSMYLRVEELVKQMEANGGSTLRDSLNRIERMIYLLDERQKILLGMVPYGIVETDERGRVTYVNRTYLAWTGRGEDEVHGDGWSNSVHPEDRERIRREWTEAVREQRAYEGRFRMLDVHGRSFPVSSKAVPMYADTPGSHQPIYPAPIGWLAVLQRCDLEECIERGECVFGADPCRDHLAGRPPIRIQNAKEPGQGTPQTGLRDAGTPQP